MCRSTKLSVRLTRANPSSLRSWPTTLSGPPGSLPAHQTQRHLLPHGFRLDLRINAQLLAAPDDRHTGPIWHFFKLVDHLCQLCMCPNSIHNLWSSTMMLEGPPLPSDGGRQQGDGLSSSCGRINQCDPTFLARLHDPVGNLHLRCHWRKRKNKLYSMQEPPLTTPSNIHWTWAAEYPFRERWIRRRTYRHAAF